MINIGFIGTGNMGRWQAASFKNLSDFKIVAGSDPTGVARAEFSKMCPGAAVYIDYKDLIADKKVDAVVVSVPTFYHKGIVVDCLKSGRPVLCEKPMARTVKDCQEMNDAAEKAGKLLMIAHCRRFDTDWGTFANVYRAGEIGTPVLWRSVRAGIGPLSPWFLDEKLGGGPLMDGAVHDQDFGNWLFGDPESVIGSSIKFDPKCTAIDTGSVVIRYKSGCQMMLSWSWAVHGQSLHDVLGPKGTFVFGAPGMSPPEGLKAHSILDSHGEKRMVTFEPKDMYLTQAQHFLDCLTTKTKCMSPGTEAIKAVAVAEAVLKAAGENANVKIAW